MFLWKWAMFPVGASLCNTGVAVTGHVDQLTLSKGSALSSDLQRFRPDAARLQVTTQGEMLRCWTQVLPIHSDHSGLSENVVYP